MGTLLRDFASYETRRAAFAELIGTFFLTLAALLSGTPYAVALVLTAFVYAIGNISGCNINPAVTVALVTLRRLPVATGLLYVIAQVAGAVLAHIAAPQVGHLATAYPTTTSGAEFFGTAFLILTVIAVSDKYVPQAGSGLAIGAALAAGLVTSGGILNPAVAIAMNQGLSPAVWAPVVSGIIFAVLFRLYAPPQAAPSASPSAAPTASDHGAAASAR